MEISRSPFQGVKNILRFNAPFYWIAGFLIVLTSGISPFLSNALQSLTLSVMVFAFGLILISLGVSYWVYDQSSLYQLDWCPDLNGKRVLLVHAGFDECSAIVQAKYPEAQLVNCDFYDPAKHTEPSIRKARMAYPPASGTLAISTDKLPFDAHSFDGVIAFLSAHEIRDAEERNIFFLELNRITKASGHVFVTEHLRDWANFLAYSIGFFHFHGKSSWLNTFHKANLSLVEELKTTPFISTFKLQPDGTST